MVSKNLLIDFTAEIHGFLHVATRPFTPPCNLGEVLESVFAAISVYGCAEAELSDVAITLAYDVMHGEVRIEEGDIPPGPHQDMYVAVMRMGIGMRDRILEFGGYLQPDGYFPYLFEEVICDHLVRFTKADYEEFGRASAHSYFSGLGYRP